MFVEYLSYLATFVATIGLAVIGTLLSFQCFQNLKKPVLQILLYYQIFLFSFFIYGIWGNIAIREIMADINLAIELENKLAFFVPLIGTPFLILSWFMLLKFGFNLNGFELPRSVVYFYFAFFLTGIALIAYFIEIEWIKIPDNPDITITRALIIINLVIHLSLIYPFIKPKKTLPVSYDKNDLKKTYFLYFFGVVLYSIFLTFFEVFGFISTCISVLVLFAASIIIPVRLKFMSTKKEEFKNMDYTSFCSVYDISKRESEIVWEICTGKTNKAIAEKLFITLQTVKDHTHRIYTKTEVKSRVQLANLVREKTGIKEFSA